MKKIFGALFVILFLVTSCSTTSTIGNGKLDPIEAATINLAVSMALQAYPEATLPAYGVATALLALLADNAKKEMVSLSMLDEVLKNETDKLKLDPVTKQAFNDLVVIVKTEIENNINMAGMSEADKLVVVMDVVKVVQQTASLKLQLLNTKQ